jgi:hypothetical protein
VEKQLLTGLQCRREAEASSLIVRVLGDGVSEEKELFVLWKLSGISHQLCTLPDIHWPLTMSTEWGYRVRQWYHKMQRLAQMVAEISPTLPSSV